jgi:GNAT superfamily N-acetyltransferase
VDDQPAGLVAGTTWPDEDPDRRHLISMWVRPSHRGLGIAAQLIAVVRDWAADAGAHELELWVADGNDAAVRTYAGAGFVPTGRRQPLPSNPAVGEEMWVLAINTAHRAQPREAVENPG